MNRLFFTVILSLLFVHFSCTDKNNWTSVRKIYDYQIAIQPFKGIDRKTVAEIKEGLDQKINAVITIMDETALPATAFYPKRHRYIADSLLVFLKQVKQDRFDKMLGITASDISIRKPTHANWAVMGLGYCPGKACVISSFRVKKTSQNRKQFIRRMIVLSLHELGHTFSLPHCTNQPCIMNDAEGKMKLDHTDKYCTDCEFHLKWIGLLN